MSRRHADVPARRVSACFALLLLSACAPAAPSRAATALPLRLVTDVPLDGTSRRFEGQSLDAKTGILFIADLAGGRVVAFDTKRDRVVKVIRDLPSAQGILAVPQIHRVYVSEPGAYEIAVIDETTYEVVARLPGGRYPSAMAWDSVRQKLYVSDVIGQTETVIDTRHNKYVAAIPLGGEAGDSQFDRNENLVYVNVTTKNELVAIDPVLNAVVARYPLAGCIDNVGLLVDDVNRLAYIACRGNARLVTFDLRPHRQRAATPTGADPNALAWDPATSVLYVACERGTISIFSVAGGRLRKAAEGALSDDAHSLAVDSAAHRVYFASPDAVGRPVIHVMQSTLSADRARVRPLRLSARSERTPVP
jgi:DNA-binding beta-propeller fold protein YncE